MPKDVSRQAPMIARPGSDADDAAGGDAVESASDRAQAMRARLGAQRDAEDLLAEASELRRAAAEDADHIVADAETVAEQLVSEAREAADKLAREAGAAADKLTTEAKERADGIFARARLEADDLQRHTEEERARIREEVLAAGRAEIEEFRNRSAALLAGAEDGLRQIAPSLEAAVTTVAETLRSLEQLRDGGSAVTGGQQAALVLASVPVGDDAVDGTNDAAESADAMVAEGAPPAAGDDPDARPLGWLFRASQS